MPGNSSVGAHGLLRYKDGKDGHLLIKACTFADVIEIPCTALNFDLFHFIEMIYAFHILFNIRIHCVVACWFS